MKLLIREKAFSWTDTFTVKDEQGNDKYFVKGELFSFGRKLHVSDRTGREIARVEQELFRFRPRYTLYVGDRRAAEVVKEFSFWTPRYTVEGPGWDVEGEFWGHDYSVTKNGTPVVSISKEWFTWGDCYVLDIAAGADELTAMATVLAIDCIIEQQSN